MKIVWSEPAGAELKELLDRIERDRPSAAAEVYRKIMIERLVHCPRPPGLIAPRKWANHF